MTDSHWVVILNEVKDLMRKMSQQQFRRPQMQPDTL
jgi:hypothetical protein